MKLQSLAVKLTMLLAMAAFMLPARAANAPIGATAPETYEFGGETREYWLYLPEGQTDGKPLIVLLHGYGGKAKGYQQKLVDRALERGFAVCVPQGAKDGRGRNCWNVGYCFHEGLERDDVAFIRELCGHLQKTYGLSRRNTFLTGMSNGGEMCYLFAFRSPETFSAIASMAGLLMQWIPEKYGKVRKPVAFMEVHGTADHTSEWDGDLTNAGGWGEYLGVETAVRYVTSAARCKKETTETLPLLDENKPSNTVVLHRFEGGRKPVLLYEVKGGKHSWATDAFDSIGAILDFFEARIK